MQKIPQGQNPPILSYAPMPTPVVYSSNGLDSRCLGAASILDNANNAYIFAGDAGKLYKMVSGSSTFSDISKGGGYSTSAEEIWSFSSYKIRILATNYANPIQTYVLGASTAFSDLSGDAPKAKYVTTIKNWVVAANTIDPGDGTQQKRLWWSAVDNPTLWPTPGTNAAISVSSDYRDIIEDVGQIQGIVGGLANSDGLIFCERAVYRMNYSGARTIFEIKTAAETRGTPAPNSIVKASNLVYFLGEDGFYSHDGLRVNPIGQGRVNKTFYREVDLSNITRVVGIADPIFPVIFWCYPGPGNNQGTPNCLLCYNYAIDEWSKADAGAESNLENLVRSLSIGYSLDSLDSTGFNLDTLPFSLDSRVWTAGSPLLGCFTTDHKLAHFTGPPYQGEVETVEITHPNSRRLSITNARAIVDGGVPTVSISVRENPEESPVYQTPVQTNIYGTAPQRCAGRYLRGKIIMPAGSSYSQISGLELDINQEGTR